MGGSAFLELFEDVSLYLVCQLLKGCNTCCTCLLLYQEPYLIVRWLANYFLFYLQALYVICQRFVDPRFQVVERYPVQYAPCVAYLEDWLHAAVELAPTALLIVLDSLYYACLDRVLVDIQQQNGEISPCLILYAPAVAFTLSSLPPFLYC